MSQPTEKTHLVPVRVQRLVGLSKDELPVLVLVREPVPISNPVLLLGKRHPVGAVDRAKTSGRFSRHFLAHSLKQGQGQDDPGEAFQYRAAIEFELVLHGLIINSLEASVYRN
jgi:hypothetical protein